MEKKFLKALFILSIIAFIVIISDVITPFAIGAVLAYMLNPVTSKLQKYIKYRWAASLMVTISFLLTWGMLVLFIVPMISVSFLDIIGRASKQILFIKKYLLGLFDTMGISSYSILDSIKLNAVSVSDHAFEIFKNLFESGGAIIGFFNVLILLPIILYYFLSDYNRIASYIKLSMGEKFRAKFISISKEILDIIKSYCVGQIIVAMIMILYYVTTLTLVGIDDSIAIGMVTGILTIIPYIGAAFSLLLTVVISYFQFETLEIIGIIVTIFAVGQFVESNYVIPKIIGNKLNISPIASIFIIVTCAHLFGFVGIIIALPLAAIVMVLYRETYIYLFKQ